MSALLSSNIQLADYQYKVIKRVLQDPVQRYLLADEVGLGKTIEAGVLIRQFLLDARGRARVLVVTPHSLVAQWRNELVHRFNLDAWLDKSLNVIASSKLSDLRSLLTDADMLVVDEAHHLSDLQDEEGISFFELVRQRAPSVQALLLLSATPALADTRGFQRILHLLDPVVFPLDDLKGFEQRIQSRQLVAELAARLIPENLLMMEDDLDRLMASFGDDALLKAQVARLRPIVQSLPDENAEDFVDALDAVRVHIAETYKLHRRILRNRRRSFPWATPKRSGLRSVSYHCQDLLQRQHTLDELRLQLVNQGGFDRLGTEFLRFAVQPTTPHSLRSLLHSKGLATSDNSALAQQVDDLASQARKHERRVRALVQEIQSLLCAAQTQVAIFCEESETADAVFDDLQALLRDQVVRHSVQDEDSAGRPEREAGTWSTDDWRRFMHQAENCRVLVCDKRAEEGLNLHGGKKVVVHYDMPVSPNRVEQRMGRFDRFGSGAAIESVAIVCADDPNEVAWVNCLDTGFEVFNQSLASLQYLVDEALQTLTGDWLGHGTRAVDDLTNQLKGPAGWMARERRRIDQQDTLDSLGSTPDHGFDELESVDGDWKSWGRAFIGLAEKTLQLGRNPCAWHSPLPPGEEVFRLRYVPYGDAPTLFPLSTFVSDFVGTLDLQAPGASSRKLLSYPYSLRRSTALSRDAYELRVRPIRYGDPLVDALWTFCETDDRGRAFAMWRQWPDYSPSDASGHDLFFRFDFLVEANLDAAGAVRGVVDHALRRRIDGCFPPEFVTIWLAADGSPVLSPTAEMATDYRPKGIATGTGRDFNLNPGRWQQLATRDDVPWLQNWDGLCRRLHAKALDCVAAQAALNDRMAQGQRLLNEQLQIRLAQLENRIERLSGLARQSEEAELQSERECHVRLLCAIARPTFQLDVVGAVIVSPDPFGHE